MQISNEAALRDLFRRGVTSIGGRSKHLEDSINVGIPDVVAQIVSTTRWIEVKHIKAWPKRAKTPVRLKHFSPAQIGFLMSWQCTWVLLGVGSGEALVFRGCVFADLYAHGSAPTRFALIECSAGQLVVPEGIGLSVIEASKLASFVFYL
jgi:hypothetical protein